MEVNIQIRESILFDEERATATDIVLRVEREKVDTFEQINELNEATRHFTPPLSEEVEDTGA